MQQLGWFFAGISLGTLLGVFVMCLAKITENEKPEPRFTDEDITPRPRLVLVRR